MKANVWGANGYIGQHIVWYLHHKGWQLQCFDIQEALIINIDVPYFQVDITDKNKVSNLDYNCDYLFFFVGLTGTLNSFEKYDSFVKVNELGLLHVLDTIKNLTNKPQIVFPSTRLVYKGQKNYPLKEDALKEFKTIYASSKYNGELYLEMYKNLYDIDYTIFRICVPYGNIFNTNFSYGTIGFFLGRAIKQLPLILFGDGSLKRTFTHVMDICTQILEVLQLDQSKNQCFNIKGETYSLLDIANFFAAKYDVSVQHVVWPAEALKLESGDTIFDATKIKKFLSVETDSTYSFLKWLHT